MDTIAAALNSLRICVFVGVLTGLCLQSQGLLQGPSDYCFLEVFEPKCSDDKVILINTALYGRMEAGRCVEAGLPKLGCYANVQRIMDNLCSGRQSCSVQVIHPTLAYTNPCSSVTLPSYLKVSHSCEKVENAMQTCQKHKPLNINSIKGFLAAPSHLKNCPIILTANKGSKFNLTLFNFLKPKERSACYEVATIKDGHSQKTVHACENNERAKTVHISSSSTLEITFTHSEEMAKLGKVMIYYEAMGCPQPPVPENGHAIREGDTATIVCNNSDTTWTTTCKDNKWTESERECPAGGWTLSDIVKTSKEFPYGIFLTSIIGVSLGVLIGGFLLFLAINAFRRYQRRDQQYGPPPVIPDPDYKIYDTARMDLPFVPGYGHSTLPRHQMAADDAPPAPPPLSEATMKRLSRHTYERPNFPPP